MSTHSTEILIAGAGPVGLVLACELRLGGAEVLVVERDVTSDPLLTRGPMGARSINALTATTLARHGLLEAVKAAALWWFDPSAAELPPFIGHFGGIPLRGHNIDRNHPMLAGHTLGGGAIAIGDLVAILAARAEALGVKVERGAALVGLAADADGIDVALGDRHVRAAYLVGCDGGRSTVRKLAGFDFPGTDPELIGRAAMVDLIVPDSMPVSDWIHTDHGAYLHGPPGRIHIVEPYDRGRPVDRAAPVTREELEQSLHRVSGRTIGIAAVHAATRYTDAARQASTYRRGRILLAGDAAHIHSPAGGQGLNQGIGDATNLGPKLAAVVHGTADPTLLDSYTVERHPVGRAVLRWTRAQTALARRDPHAQALREIVTDLLDSPHATGYVLGMLSGLAPR